MISQSMIDQVSQQAVVGTQSSAILDDNVIETTTLSEYEYGDYSGDYEDYGDQGLDNIGPGACLFDGKVSEKKTTL